MEIKRIAYFPKNILTSEVLKTSKVLASTNEIRITIAENKKKFLLVI